MRDKDVLDKLFGKSADQPKEVKPVAQPASKLATTNGCDKLRELPISLLQDFPADKHPFRPYTKPKLEALKQDIIERGIIQPLIVRSLADDQYEIISGHNRKTAAQEVGYIVLPCIVRSLNDDEALLQMISTNLQQRQDLRYSEKAFAYKIQMETLRHQGMRTDLTPSQFGTKRSDEIIAEQAGESRNQIQRYIRLTYLIPELLEKVDERKLGFTVGETLSYLRLPHQQMVEDFFFEQRSLTLDQRVADTLRKMEASGEFTEARLEAAFLSSAVKPLRKVTIGMASIGHYFPKEATEREIQNTIMEALKLYFEEQNK